MSSYWRDWDRLIVREESANLFPYRRCGKTPTLECGAKLLSPPSAGGKLLRRSIERPAQHLIIDDPRNGGICKLALDTFCDQPGTEHRRAFRMTLEAPADELLGEAAVIEQAFFGELMHGRSDRLPAESALGELRFELARGVIATGNQLHRLLVREGELVPGGSGLERFAVGRLALDDREARDIITRNQKKGPVVERNDARRGSLPADARYCWLSAWRTGTSFGHLVDRISFAPPCVDHGS